MKILVKINKFFILVIIQLYEIKTEDIYEDFSKDK